ncbi:phosphoenolpyruvate synthase [Marinicaulis aureus]|uniref:Phosphoenolpyruvate synthase n=1 Tax=Hyphococcus aureus TaxID=2666033 RepID=A0ABW1L0D7_9PROT
MTDYIAWFSDISRDDVARVGGKNASLGELVSNLFEAGVRVPGGFAVTAAAYKKFLEANGLDEKLARELARYEKDSGALADVGRAVRALILEGEMPEVLADAIRGAYEKLAEGGPAPSVAARSSATAEDLPEASFAGQLETYLNVQGAAALMEACRKCFSSLYTDRAISYRRNHGFGQMDVAVSVGVQRMVRSDEGSSGVMFSIDTESGFPNIVLINGAWGLGETVVQGMVDPDEYEVFKPLLNNATLSPILHKKCGAKEQKMVYATGGDRPVALKQTSPEERNAYVLTESEILTLSRWALKIEDHYGQAMDMEWAKDGETGELFIVQARPETVQTRKAAGALKTYHLKGSGTRLLEGSAIGDAIASGKVCRIESADHIANFKDGSVLVTKTTDPDWAPIMKKAAAIVTDHGGRTSHAAIVSRELGLPAIVGAGNATEILRDGQDVTVSCAEGETGYVYDGLLDFDSRALDLTAAPKTHTQIMLNMANPSTAYRWWRLPSDGVGLARIEFIISDIIKIHPLALARFDSLEDKRARQEIEKLTRAYDDKEEYFIDLLSRGVARIAAAHYPNPVIVRLSDFKTNEYASLIGGKAFEPEEDNPMIGWRGASRYYHDNYRDGFALECRAMRRARETLGLSNIKLMIPFCRTLEEADRVIEEMAGNGLKRGEHGLEIYVMAEIPSNIILAEAFADRFDGFSIGSNDLTQLTLGIDRDSAMLQPLFDERNAAVTTLISELIKKAGAKGAPVGICGQAPSDYPEFTAFLVEEGVTSISVNPDSFLKVKETVAAAEKPR